MPVNITIRAVPDEVRDELASRAAASGRSLQEYLSAELAELAAKPSVMEALHRARLHARGLPPIRRDDLIAELEADRR